MVKARGKDLEVIYTWKSWNYGKYSKKIRGEATVGWNMRSREGKGKWHDMIRKETGKIQNPRWVTEYISQRWSYFSLITFPKTNFPLHHTTSCRGGVRGERDGMNQNWALVPLLLFAFKPKKHELQQNLRKQRTGSILRILWVSTKYLHISDQFYFNWVKYRPKPITKTLLILSRTCNSALPLTKIPPPTLRPAFYPFQGFRLHKLHL